MLKSKSFVKRTKKGAVVKVVKEHYLRDDIWCSVQGCTGCGHTDPVLSTPMVNDKVSPLPFYIVPDTNILFHQIDLLSHHFWKDLIIPQTATEELRHRSLPVYTKFKNLLEDKERRIYIFSNEHHRETYVERLKDESPNDRNDRAIRAVAQWYTKHLLPLKRTVILVTDDADCRKRAKQENGLVAMSAQELVSLLNPALMDMLAAKESADALDFKKFKYDEHVSQLSIQNGLKKGSLYQGSVNISMHNYLEGTIFATVDGQERSIIISGRAHLNRAMHGDAVAVELLPKTQWRKIGDEEAVLDDEDEAINVDAESASDLKEKDVMSMDIDASNLLPTGRVVGIIKRAWRQYCGSLDPKSVNPNASDGTSQSCLFVGVDRRIPKIRIQTRQAKELVGKRIIVAVDAWNKTNMFPSGHFVKILGDLGDKNTETSVLLLEHDVAYTPFSQQVLNCLPEEGDKWVVRPNHLDGRWDLRNENICSIDPPGCTDIDDALHAKILPNGNVEVGVHIADVTHFVKPNTAMDIEASQRGTTVYLVDKRIDMLPSLLGTNLCSLRQHVERLAFSVIWEMTPNAEVVNVRYNKSVIKSKHSFTYDEAQSRIDDQSKKDDLTNSIRQLNKLAKILRGRRMEAGALTLASPEVRFKLENDGQDPVDVELKALKETNALVEEFMLLANIYVAKRIFEKFADSAMLRRHPTPPPTNFETLVHACKDFGIEIDYSTSKKLAESLDAAVDPANPYLNTLLRIMTTRCMMQAVYFSSGTLPEKDFWHYGLATGIYTHFTSPIRRYCDVIVHRQLAACIGVDTYGPELTDKLQMQALCNNLNYRNRMAQMASRASVELFTNLFFKGHENYEDGYVIRVLKNGFAVLVPKFGIEAIVTTPDSKFVFDPKNNCLQSLVTEDTIKLFLPVRVRITIEETGVGGLRSKLNMCLVHPSIPDFSVPESKDLNSTERGLKRKIVEDNQ